jgi:hypothetical protein
MRVFSLAALHGDGLASLQSREVQGAAMSDPTTTHRDR